MSSITDVGPVPATRTGAGTPRPDRKPRGTVLFGVIVVIGSIIIATFALRVVSSLFTQENR